MVDEIAHIIPTHERPGVAQRLINSINEHYPGSNIYVCDDSKRPAKYEGATNVVSPAYDIGLSAKRNRLVQVSDEPYIFLWDDDLMVTEDTSFEMFYHTLKELDDVGVVGGEWLLTHKGKRDVWFNGKFWVEGPIEKHRPLSKAPDSVETDVGPVRVHYPMFVPNWALMARETVENVYWDERLKLQEHSEFYARMAGARAKRGTKMYDEDEIWLDRLTNREFGNDNWFRDQNGRVQVYMLSTLRNRDKLSHVGGRVSRGEWIYVDPDYAKELMNRGYAYGRKESLDARPFPVPDVPKDVPLNVAFIPDTTCLHFRWDDSSRSEEYNQNRTRDRFMAAQKEKLGTEELDLKQWSTYPYEEKDWIQVEDVESSIPQNFSYYDQN